MCAVSLKIIPGWMPDFESKEILAMDVHICVVMLPVTALVINMNDSNIPLDWMIIFALSVVHFNLRCDIQVVGDQHHIIDVHTPQIMPFQIYDSGQWPGLKIPHWKGAHLHMSGSLP